MFIPYLIDSIKYFQHLLYNNIIFKILYNEILKNKNELKTDLLYHINMSIRIKLDSLSLPQRTVLVEQLKFEKKRTNFNKFQTLPTIRPYLIETDQTDNVDYVYIPFYW